MKYFHYSATGGQGAQMRGWLMALDREDAVTQLRSRGIHPFAVKEGPGRIPLRVDEDELLVSMRELASLRSSGMSIDDAVAAVLETTEDKLLMRAWRQVHQAVRGGSSLSDAFAGVPNAFPSYAIPLIRLGEAKGELAHATNLVANRLEEESALKSEIRAALAYPLFLIILSISVVLFMLVSIVPEFGSIVADSPEDIGGSMRLLLAVSGLLIDYAWLWLALILLLAGSCFYLWREGKIQAIAWELLRRLPGIRSVVEAWQVVQFSNGMSHLLAGRVSVLDAVRLSAQSLGRDDVQRRMSRVTELIRQGESLGSALATVEAFPKLVTQMVVVGEKSAHLVEAMEEISKLYTRRMRESIRKSMSVLEPAVIAIMGVIVGGIIISLLTAIISINDIPL